MDLAYRHHLILCAVWQPRETLEVEDALSRYFVLPTVMVPFAVLLALPSVSELQVETDGTMEFGCVIHLSTSSVGGPFGDNGTHRRLRRASPVLTF